MLFTMFLHDIVQKHSHTQQYSHSTHLLSVHVCAPAGGDRGIDVYGLTRENN